jgi:AcrR family transcriptional regulator
VTPRPPTPCAGSSATLGAVAIAAVPTPPGRNALETRARILAAARVRFAATVYERVGTREIAADAGVDAALVSRYFGSKEKLFDAAIEGVFALGDQLAGPVATLGERMTRLVIDSNPHRAGCDIDGLGLLLRATGSPATAAMVSARFRADFVQPLAGLLRGRDAELRAGLIASYLVGLATMMYGFGVEPPGPAAQRRTIAFVGAAIQACVAG